MDDEHCSSIENACTVPYEGDNFANYEMDNF